jgi:NTE family protein
MRNIRMDFLKRKRDKVLVLSGGWFRWFYSIGVLKGLEERGVDKEIKAIFGVSIGAIIWSLWAKGVEADEIYKILSSLSVWKFYGKDMFQKTWWFLSNRKIKNLIEKHLPKRFSGLKKKLYVGVVDTNTAKYMLLDKWSLPDIVLWSMSIPGVFPPVEYRNHLLVDGGVLDNFPVYKAKRKYPKAKIIWVALNKFEKNQKIKSIVDNIIINFEIVLRAKLLEDTKKVDYLFYKKVPIPILSLDKKKMKQAFEMGYNDCMRKFK